MSFMIETECINLATLQQYLFKEYEAYKQGLITEKEYLCRIKPIDSAIDKIEISVLKNYLTTKMDNACLKL